METRNSFETWSNFDLVSAADFDVFSFPNQPLPLNSNAEDSDIFSFSSQLLPPNFSEHTALDQFDLPMQETAFGTVPLDAIPLNEDMLVHDPFYSLIDFEQREIISGLGNEFGVRTHDMHNIKIQDIISDEIPIEKKRIKRQREKKSNSSQTLSRETILQYFYLPIKSATKELNIGLTRLKNRCRELGIHRWPHRKLMSLETLIQNVQIQNKEEGHMAEKKLKEAIEILECEKQLVEESPDMQLEDQTQKWRQACFKAKYNEKLKYNKFKGIIKSQDSFHSNFTTNSATSLDVDSKGKEKEEDAEENELKSIIANCLSSSNVNMEIEQLQTFTRDLSALLKRSNYKHASSSSHEHQWDE